jgi:DNA-binding FadR family transcriptional regulator
MLEHTEARGRGVAFANKFDRRLHSSVAQQIAVQILGGVLPVGHLFPTEIEHAEQLGISRSALREAFRVLAAKGLVHSRPKAGTRVSERRRWSFLDVDVLAWQFEAEPSQEFLRALFELRMVVEPAAAAMAAQRRTDAHLADMANALDVMERHGLATETGRAADQRFHSILIEATGNEPMIALSSSIMAAIAWTTIYKQRKRALPRDPVPDHRKLHEAIVAGSGAKASRAMTDLVKLALADTEIALREG